METFTAPDPLTPALTKYWDTEESWTLATALRNGAFLGLMRA